MRTPAPLTCAALAAGVRVSQPLNGDDETDGLEATAAPLGPGFPAGILVVMNSSGRNFHLHSWQALLAEP